MKPDQSSLFPRAFSAEMPGNPAPNGDLGGSASVPTRASAGRVGAQVISVSELNRRARSALESQIELVWVAGELSNVIRAASGHWYFALKDANAQVKCVMFRHRAQALGFVPENGMQVEVRALPSLYEPRGEFQLGVEGMRRAGLGALYEAFERLKAKLADEGLFDPARKRELPRFPRCIAVVTSTKAAALRDVLTTIARRAPFVSVIVYPTAVQGAQAPGEIVAAIAHISERRAVDKPDAVLICRGGGSIEDLWCFNDEAVARAIASFQTDTQIPVVSAVGHETDFTIADFVADLRAPTPTAGAEMLTPDGEALARTLHDRHDSLRRTIERAIERRQQQIDHAARGLVSPRQRIEFESARVRVTRARASSALHARLHAAQLGCAQLRLRLQAMSPSIVVARHADGLAVLAARRSRAVQEALHAQAMRLGSRQQALELLNPHNVLARGYALVTTASGVARDAATLTPGEQISVQLAKGRVDAAVLRSTD